MEQFFRFRTFQDFSKNPLLCNYDNEKLLVFAKWDNKEIVDSYFYCISCDFILIPGIDTIEKINKEIAEMRINDSQ